MSGESHEKTRFTESELRAEVGRHGSLVAAIAYGVTAGQIADPELAAAWTIAEGCYNWETDRLDSNGDFEITRAIWRLEARLGL